MKSAHLISAGSFREQEYGEDTRLYNTFGIRDGLTNRLARLRHIVAIVAALVMCLQNVALRGQSLDRQFRQSVWTTEDGLPQNSVNSIVQGPEGFLWLATYDGLVRFDGATFRVYTAGNTAGLTSNRITSLYREKGTIWISTEDGLSFYRDGRFTSISMSETLRDGYVNTVTKDSTGVLWISTPDDANGGLVLYRDGEIVELDLSVSEEIAGSTILFTDSRGRVWVAGRHRVYRASNDSITPVKTPDIAEDDQIRLIAEDAEGTVRFATRFGAVAELVDGKFELDYRIDAPAAGIERYYAGPEGTLWAASPSWFELYEDGRPVARLKSRASGTPGIRSIARDDEGNVWIGTNGSGLIRISEALFRVVGQKQGLKHEVALSLTQGPDGTVWVSTNCGGIYQIRNGQAAPFRHSDVPGDACAYSVLAEPDGTVWIGHEALVRIRDGVSTRFDQQDGLALNTAGRSDFILALYRDPYDSENLWVGTHEGMHLFDGNRFTRYTREDGLAHNHVRGFYRDRSGTLWVATRGGVSAFDGTSFKTYSEKDGLSSNNVRSFYQDIRGNLWIGTYGGGLNRLKDGQFKPITRADGLFDNVVSSIQEVDGTLWMSGNRGIFRVRWSDLDEYADGERDHLVSIGYRHASGLTNPETNGGFQPAAWKADDGRLWYPTLSGVAVIDPMDTANNKVPPRVFVEDVRFNNESIPFDEQVELSEGRRSFEVGYTAINFSAPERVQFEYTLEGFSDGWTRAETRRKAFYTNVPPGEYTFRVRASNRGGQWSEQPASLSIFVKPFIWQRGLFYVGLGAILLVLTGAFIWRRVQLRRRRELQLNRKVRLRTAELREALDVVESQKEQLKRLDEAKSRFFANTSHELRTPLTLILGPVQQIVDGCYGDIHPDIESDLRLVRQNANRLLHLINQLLDLARLDAGEVDFSPTRINMVHFIREHIALFSSIAEMRNLELKFESVLTDYSMVVDRDKIDKVFVNLLSNAIKFTPEGGRVSVHLHPRDGGGAALMVKDTGPGISAEDQDHLFDRFFQSGQVASSGSGGSGIGLSLAHELVQLHGGTISVQSDGKSGSTFTVELPQLDLPEADVVDPAADSPSTTRQQTDRNIEDEIEQIGEDTPIILVVEDNRDLMNYMRKILPDFGVIGAENGAEGLDIAREYIPDIILSDVMMPQMNGFELCKAIKSDDRTSHIPVVMLTARVGSDSKIEGLDAGADAYIGKPFKADELVARVKNLLEQRLRLGRSRGEAAEVDEADRRSPGVAEVTDNLPDREAEFVLNVINAVRDNVDNYSFGVDRLAEAVHMSRRQLTRKLRALLDESPGVLIRRIRMERAAELIERREMTVQEISESVGYRSAAHFSQAFSEQFGSPPTEYGLDRESFTP